MAATGVQDSATIVNNLISDYYRSAADLAPDRISEREFGVGNYDIKIAQRHMSFPSERELRNYLSANSVPYVSASAAYYRFPSARPMDRKGWLGSELVFDLDVTDMDLACQRSHGKSWVCAICFDEVRKETARLIYDFLIPDFGFSESEIKVNFSGNRGYHVHVSSADILKLGAAARREITAYISGSGIEFGDLFRVGSYATASDRAGKKLLGPRPTDLGWKGKVAKKFTESLNAGIDSLVQIGLDREIATKIYRKKELMKLGLNSGNWDMIAGIKSKEQVWKRMLETMDIAQGDRIDSNVTNDPSHLLRLANSIHGGTGLIAKKLRSPRELYRFDPTKDAIAFRKGFATIDANTTFELRMNGQKFGPYGGRIRVPIYVAAYLYLKGYAKIAAVE